MTTRTLPAPRRAPAILRELAAFLRRPRLLQPAGLRAAESWRALALLTALHVGVMLVAILPLIALWQKRFGLPMPDAFGKLPSGWLIPITVLVAPVLEEILFRGWQTGRPRALWLLGSVAAFGVLLVASPGLKPLAVAALLLALLVAALGGWLWLRKRDEAPAWYRAAFPALFWSVALGFAAVHLMNYPSTSLASLPMVLPQLWAALLLGFTRQRLGLPAAMLQHASANACAMALSMAG